MNRIIHSISLFAASITLAAGLWQDWGLLACLKKMAIAYLG